MNKIMLLLALLLSTALGGLSYELCFEDTTLGGWIPWLNLTAGPLLGFAAGRLSYGPKP